MFLEHDLVKITQIQNDTEENNLGKIEVIKYNYERCSQS